MNSTETDPLRVSPPPPVAPLSRLAVASLILGLLGFLILPAVAGIVCGIVALVQIHRSAGALRGSGMAIAGTVVSAVMLALVPVIAIIAALMLPALAQAKAKAQTIVGLNNVKQLCLALRMYADDSKDLLPAGTNWCDAVRPFLGGNTRVFLVPESRPADVAELRSSFGLNARLEGAKLPEASPQTVLVFEMDAARWNTTGGPELLRRTGRRSDPVVVGFVDGHAEAIPPGPRLDSLRWDP